MIIDTGRAFWLALVQGATEFLPISSSGHLVLIPRLLGWPDQGLAFDVAVHVGTLLAVVIYLGRDIGSITRGICRGLVGGGGSPGSRLGGLIVLATLPTVLVGALIDSTYAASFQQPRVIAAATAGFAVLLLFCRPFWV